MDVRFVAQAALHEAERLVPLWLPDDPRVGSGWHGTRPAPNEHFGSFKVNVTTGQWSDFASGDKVGDLVGLYAYLRTQSKRSGARISSRPLHPWA